jgi:hypothetical protein
LHFLNYNYVMYLCQWFVNHFVKSVIINELIPILFV